MVMHVSSGRRGLSSCGGRGRWVEPLESRTFLSAAPASGTPALSIALTGVPTVELTNAPTKDKVTVTVTNTGTGTAKGPLTVQFLASADKTLDPGDSPVVTFHATTSIRAGKSKVFKVKLGTIPNLANGTYWLLASASGVGTASPATTVSPNTIRIASPFVDLTGEFVKVPTMARIGRRASVSLDVINNGTDMAKGTLTVELSLSASPDGSSPNLLASNERRIQLKAAGRARMSFAGTVPKSVATGTYYLVATIDPSDAFHDAGGAPNVIVSTTPVTFV